MNTNIQFEVGARLRQLRENKGYKQKELGDLLGITPAAYGKLEAGDRGLSTEYCIAIADFYGVTCDYLLRGVETEFLDVCSKTSLTSETLEFLMSDKKEWIECKLMSERLSAEARECEDEFVRQDEIERGKGAHYLERAKELDEEAAEYWRRFCQIAERNFVINALLKDERFLDALEFAGYRAGNEVITQLYIEDTRKDGELLSEEMEEVSAGIDAAQFAVMRAFNRFFERICYNVDFLKVARAIPDDLIERAVKRNVLHYDD